MVLRLCARQIASLGRFEVGEGMTLTVSTQTHDTTKQLLLLMMIIEVVVEHISLHGDKLSTLSMKDYIQKQQYQQMEDTMTDINEVHE